VKKLFNRNEIIFHVISLMMLFLGFKTHLLFAQAKPQRIELAENWKLVSSKDVQSEGAEIHGIIWKDAQPCWVKIEGYNTPAITAAIK
jgi:hypothetical protein